MSFIHVIGEDEAEGPLFEIYDQVQRSRGRLSNIMRVHSLHPKALQNHLDLYMTLLFGKGPLSRKERELIAVAVSSANECHYCITHHTEALGKYVDDKDWLEGFASAMDVELDPREMALVAFARGLTAKPQEPQDGAVQALREAGFEDEGILHATELIAYFNFANRMAIGLGVGLEEDGKRDYDY